jgi:carbohydrate-binding DOMON domain-containing protein
MNLQRGLLLSALLISIILISFSTITFAQKTIVDVKDPIGDDRGPGYYGYPGNSVFKPGVFDITEFKVIDNGTNIIFKVYVKNLGDNPWKGPNGFCLQYIQIYVHTTLTGIPARLDTLGLNIVLRSDYAWHFALLLAPGWGKDPVPKGQRAALYYANGTIVVQDKLFKVYAEPKENAIVAVIPKKLLPDVTHMAEWKIVVAMASYDGFGPMRVRVAGIKGGEWVLNATKYATPEEVKRIAPAIAAGIEPRVLDLVIYSPSYPKGITAETQYKWLNSFDPKQKLLATVPGIPITTTTTTITKTFTTTITTTTTSTTTAERTITSATTKFITSVTTSPTTIISTTTHVITKTNWTITSILVVVLFIIGFVIGYFVRRT